MPPYLDHIKKALEDARFREGVLSKEDMDIVGGLFGIRFVSGGSPEGCFELFIEDDGHYHRHLTANNFWLEDLITVAQNALVKKFDPISVLHRQKHD